jgi:O-acetyl-ADP-ribose deacetylase (regulator of RNase III)
MESHLEVDKFILLPEHEDDYHQKKVFFTRTCAQRQSAEEKSSSNLPRPPDPKTFLGRQLEAYSIIEKLRRVDVVHLFGPSGIGKKSLAAFVANYVNERRKILFLDQVLWWPQVDPNSDDSLDSAFAKIHDLVAIAPDILADDEYQRCKRKILLHLGRQRTLLVINTCDLASADVSMLSQVLQDILNRVPSVKMLILSKSQNSVQLSTSISQGFVRLLPLTFDTTATLFAMHCEYVSQQSEHADPIVYSVTDFISLIFRRDNFRYVRHVEPDMPKRGRDLFVTLGEGHPQTILDRARSVSPDEYRAIIMTAKKFDVILEKFCTRYKLEKAILRTNIDIHHAQENGSYYKAKSLWDVLQDMERRRETLPSKEKLEQLFEVGTTKYNNDVANGQIVRAELNKQLYKLNRLKRQLKLERKAEKAAEELPEDWLILTHDVSEAPGDVSEDVASIEDIPLVARMKVVDDKSVPDIYSPEPVFTPLLKFRVNATCPFVLHINQGPVQSFSYHSLQSAAIVVASNEACTGGQGVLRSVTKAGGPTLLQHVEALSTVMDTKYGSVRCMAGDARIVGPGNYDQLHVQYVMFAVAPWFASENESHARVFLTCAYRSALELAKERKLEAVAFSLIGASCRGGKRRMEAVRIAVDFCVRFKGYPGLKEIHLFGFTPCEAKELEAASRAACETFDMCILD